MWEKKKKKEEKYQSSQSNSYILNPTAQLLWNLQNVHWAALRSLEKTNCI